MGTGQRLPLADSPPKRISFPLAIGRLFEISDLKFQRSLGYIEVLLSGERS
jgi:hypothetical protein